MSEGEIARGEKIISAAGMLFFRRNLGEIEVLTAERQNEPWKGHLAIVFGGLVQKGDKNSGMAAMREGCEKTGQTLNFRTTIRRIGDYGPQNHHHLLRRRDSELIAVPTSTPISDKHFVIIVYAAEVLSGEPTGNKEMRNFRFENPLTLADEGRPLTYIDPPVLSDFWHQMRHHDSWRDPKIASWMFTPQD